MGEGDFVVGCSWGIFLSFSLLFCFTSFGKEVSQNHWRCTRRGWGWTRWLWKSSFWPWDSEDRTKVKGLWVRHQQGHSSKQRVSRRDSDVTKNLLNICHVTGCYLHAFPNREGIKTEGRACGISLRGLTGGWRLRVGWGIKAWKFRSHKVETS